MPDYTGIAKASAVPLVTMIYALQPFSIFLKAGFR